MSRMTKDEARAYIKAGLAPLFERARVEGLWFWCRYQDLWFSPDQLAKEHAAGSFLWGAVNWSLRDPQERLKEAIARADQAAAEAQRVARSISSNS